MENVENVEQKIFGLLTELEKGIDFGKEQAPIIVEQLIKYELIICSFFSIIFLYLLHCFYF